MDKLSVHAKKTFLSQRLIAWVCCLCAIGTAAKAYANNDPTFTVSAPENIEINKQFRLTFIVSFPEKPATVEIQNLAVPKVLTQKNFLRQMSFQKYKSPAKE